MRFPLATSDLRRLVYMPMVYVAVVVFALGIAAARSADIDLKDMEKSPEVDLLRSVIGVWPYMMGITAALIGAGGSFAVAQWRLGRIEKDYFTFRQEILDQFTRNRVEVLGHLDRVNERIDMLVVRENGRQ